MSFDIPASLSRLSDPSLKTTIHFFAVNGIVRAWEFGPHRRNVWFVKSDGTETRLELLPSIPLTVGHSLALVAAKGSASEYGGTVVAIVNRSTREWFWDFTAQNTVRSWAKSSFFSGVNPKPFENHVQAICNALF